MLKKNEGLADRIIRVALGAGLLGMAFFGPRTAWGYLRLIPLATGLIGSCPAYGLFGISTCPHEKSQSRT